MDFLKKHFEKVALAVGLLLLIASAIYLSLRLGEVNQPPGQINIRGEAAVPMDLTPYAKAIESLNNPPQWHDAGPIFTPPGIIVVDNGSPPPPPPTNCLPQVLRIVREPFKLRFFSYTGEGHNFQINFRDFRKSFFVSSVDDYIKDKFEDTGYKIIKFEKKIVEEIDPNINAPVVKDISRLTIQHEGEDPIVLVWGQQAEQKEPVAVVRWGENPQPFKVRRGQRFNCAGKTYIVVDMDSKQMIIVDEQSKEKHTIGLTGSR